MSWFTRKLSYNVMKLNGYLISFYSGIIALGLSLILTLQMLAPFLDKAPSDFSPVLVGKFSLIFSVALMVVGFLFLNEKSKLDQFNFRIACGVFELLFLCILMFVYWDIGWEYILDPDGSFLLSYPFLFLSFTQGLSFFFKTE